jgi:hypothetical protein
MSSAASSKPVGPMSAAMPAAAPKSTVGIPHTQLLFMEMHDEDCSSYCLGGSLEPHKMWFGVGVHRCVARRCRQGCALGQHKQGRSC